MLPLQNNSTNITCINTILKMVNTVYKKFIYIDFSLVSRRGWQALTKTFGYPHLR
jgi:hypothetical protein